MNQDKLIRSSVYVLIIILICAQCIAQGVGIGTATPNNAAMLDVQSTTKGMLIPRMTTSERIAITGVKGLIVFDNTSSSFWFYNGSAWTELGSGGVSYWSLNGTSIYNNNTGRVGVGLINPLSELHLHSSQFFSGMRISNSTTGFSTGDGGSIGLTLNDMFINNYEDGFMQLRTNNSNRLHITNEGNVGIGTGSPLSALHVHSPLNTFNSYLRLTNSTSGLTFGDGAYMGLDGINLLFNNAETGHITFSNSTGGNKLVIAPNGNIGIDGFNPLSKLHIQNGADVSISSNGYLMMGDPTSTNLILDNNEIGFRNNGTWGELVIQNDGGSVRIGNSSVPAGYKFAVNGKVICEELKIKLASSGWPDYVFSNDYKLMPLKELSAYIQSNKHLPNIPSAGEIEKNGIEVGDMQKRMMEKVEELTLYILQLKKELDVLKNSKQ